MSSIRIDLETKITYDALKKKNLNHSILLICLTRKFEKEIIFRKTNHKIRNRNRDQLNKLCRKPVKKLQNYCRLMLEGSS